MEILKLITKYWEYNEKIPLGNSTTVIYYHLLHKWHLNHKKEFAISDVELNKNLKLAINTIKSGKKKLKENGFIEFNTINGKPSCYNILSEEKRIIEQPRVKNDLKNISQSNKNVTSKILNNKKSSIHKNIESKNEEILLESNKMIPSLDEFLNYAKTLTGYSIDIESKIEQKFFDWKNNNWNNAANKPITNWKNSLKSAIPYISEENNDIFSIKIPNIDRPSRPKK